MDARFLGLLIIDPTTISSSHNLRSTSSLGRQYKTADGEASQNNDSTDTGGFKNAPPTVVAAKYKILEAISPMLYKTMVMQDITLLQNVQYMNSF